MNNPQGKRLIPEYLLKYLEEVKNTYPEASKIVSKKYKHYCFFTLENQEVCIEITNNSQTDLTGADITTFIQSLPTNAKYPISQVGIAYDYRNMIIFINYVKNDTSGGGGIAKFVYGFANIKKATSDGNLQFTGTTTGNVYNDITITSQYAIEV